MRMRRRSESRSGAVGLRGQENMHPTGLRLPVSPRAYLAVAPSRVVAHQRCKEQAAPEGTGLLTKPPRAFSTLGLEEVQLGGQELDWARAWA